MTTRRYGRKLIKKRVEYEHLEQSALTERVRLELEPKFPECKWLYAIPNEGGKGTAGLIRSAIMKKEGARKGVSDLCLPSPRLRPAWVQQKTPGGKYYGDGNVFRTTGKYSTFLCFMGLYLEMKPAPVISPVRGNISVKKMSLEQEEFQLFVRSQGYVAFCCHGQDQAFQCLKAYLNLERIDPGGLSIHPYEFNPLTTDA